MNRPSFHRKRGARGWPGPQARAVLSAAHKCRGLVVGHRQAASGSHYIDLSVHEDFYNGPLDTWPEAKVRVADHCEHYGYDRPDFNVCPGGKTVRAVRDWIERNCPYHKMPVRECRR